MSQQPPKIASTSRGPAPETPSPRNGSADPFKTNKKKKGTDKTPSQSQSPAGESSASKSSSRKERKEEKRKKAQAQLEKEQQEQGKEQEVPEPPEQIGKRQRGEESDEEDDEEEQLEEETPAAKKKKGKEVMVEPPVEPEQPDVDQDVDMAPEDLPDEELYEKAGPEEKIGWLGEDDEDSEDEEEEIPQKQLSRLNFQKIRAESSWIDLKKEKSPQIVLGHYLAPFRNLLNDNKAKSEAAKLERRTILQQYWSNHQCSLIAAQLGVHDGDDAQRFVNEAIAYASGDEKTTAVLIPKSPWIKYTFENEEAAKKVIEKRMVMNTRTKTAFVFKAIPIEPLPYILVGVQGFDPAYHAKLVKSIQQPEELSNIEKQSRLAANINAHLQEEERDIRSTKILSPDFHTSDHNGVRPGTTVMMVMIGKEGAKRMDKGTRKKSAMVRFKQLQFRAPAKRGQGEAILSHFYFTFRGYDHCTFCHSDGHQKDYCWWNGQQFTDIYNFNLAFKTKNAPNTRGGVSIKTTAK